MRPHHRRRHRVLRCTGYLGLPETTAAALVDGWFRTGDIGLKDTDGFVRIVDRTTWWADVEDFGVSEGDGATERTSAPSAASTRIPSGSD
ncbi:AMP-binding protein [Streptomyces olivochromogenes]|nr:AMP-binding protein [Streptomyces olivochromogenes]